MVAAVGVDKAPAILAALQRAAWSIKLYIDQPAAAEVMRMASGPNIK
jgi:DNA-binding transcriptional regulator LsrR (DeoR family)